MCELVKSFRAIAFLAIACLFFLPTQGIAQVTHFDNKVTASEATLSVDLSSVSSTAGSTLAIRNNSGSKLDFPFIWNSNSPAPVISNASPATLASTTRSDEAVAIADWQYVIGQTNAYCSAGSTYGYSADPLQILYGYGFGCCGQLAPTLASLWAGDIAHRKPVWPAGIALQHPRYPTRIAVMAFHTIPEIYYGNAWHMLDPDHRVFYRNPDGSIASVAQIIANPALVADTPDGIGWNSETMAELYESNASTLQYIPLNVPAPANPLFTLLPQESMELTEQNSWPAAVYDPIAADEAPPAFISIGQISFYRVIDFNDGSTALLDEFSNVRTAVQADGRTALVTSIHGTGSLVVTKSSPFPILGVELSGEFFNNDPSGSISVETSPDGTNWSAPVIVPVEARAPAATQSIELTALLAGANSYCIKILLSGYPGGLGLYNMKVRMDGQMAAQMSPLLQPGHVNTFNYQDFSPTAQERSVEIEWAVPIGSRELKNLTATSFITEDPTYSIAADYGAPHLIDGNPLTLAYPGNAQIDYGVHLNVPSHVTQVSIWWGYFGTDPIYVNSWSLYGRNGTNGSWDLIQTGGFPNASETDIPVDTTTTDLRLTASGNNWIGVYEFKAYGDEVAPRGTSSQLTPVSVTSNIPISSVSGYPTANLMDGNPSTLAYPGAPEVDYEVDFGKDITINLANINWGYFGTSSLYVQQWTIFGQQNGEFGWTLLAQGGFPAAEQTQTNINRTIRRLRLRAASLNWIGVYEFSVFGVPPEISKPFSVNESRKNQNQNLLIPVDLLHGNLR